MLLRKKVLTIMIEVNQKDIDDNQKKYELDIQNLKKKVEAGCDRFTGKTQCIGNRCAT